MRLRLQGLEPKCKAFGFVLPTSIPRFKFLHVCSTFSYSRFQFEMFVLNA